MHFIVYTLQSRPDSQHDNVHVLKHTCHFYGFPSFTNNHQYVTLFSLINTHGNLSTLILGVGEGTMRNYDYEVPFLGNLNTPFKHGIYRACTFQVDI